MRSTVLFVALAAVGLTSPSFAQQHQIPRGKPTPVITESEISGASGHQLRVITNDFVANGGDKIMDATPFTVGELMAESVVSCLKKKATISPKIDGRIVVEA